LFGSTVDARRGEDPRHEHRAPRPQASASAAFGGLIFFQAKIRFLLLLMFLINSFRFPRTTLSLEYCIVLGPLRRRVKTGSVAPFGVFHGNLGGLIPPRRTAFDRVSATPFTGAFMFSRPFRDLLLFRPLVWLSLASSSYRKGAGFSKARGQLGGSALGGSQ